MRYTIGIDLGTTSSCVAYIDTHHPALSLQQFQIPQLKAAGHVDRLATLPSFCYLSTIEEWPKEALSLPWEANSLPIVGKMAQIEGSKVPTRIVQSAKSWLCHPTANRRDKILPLESDPSCECISPVEASARYLIHIRNAWNFVIGKGDVEQEFEQQQIILTVPASFDEVARSLTVEAATQAGISQLILLEEPQAAFYSWLAQNEATWQQQLYPGAIVLVCDIGGGTTDFSLIEVSGTPEAPILQRIAVGDHLLLGGDNMDSTIAHYLEPNLFQQEASASEWLYLKHEARTAKEALLTPLEKKSEISIVLQGKGASVIGKSSSTLLQRETLEKLLLEGFFGQYDWNEAIQLQKSSGMRTMGLPYENDPSITKHLANFLKTHASGSLLPSKPNFVLFHGATVKPKIFQQAICSSLDRWLPGDSPTILPSSHLDLAVSRGAAYYGKVQRGLGVKIGGGTARGFYLGLDIKQNDGSTERKALTLLPRGAEENTSYEPSHTFLLQPNTAVEFQVYTSHTRLNDTSGDIVAIAPEEFHPLPPVRTLLRYGKKQLLESSQKAIPVHLKIFLNALGILEIALKSQKTTHHWKLEFQLRTASGQDHLFHPANRERKDEIFDKQELKKCFDAIECAFVSEEKIKVTQLVETLETILELPRREWSPSILRALWETLLKQAPHRKLTPAHEIRWWNLIGFCLRPGFGHPMDDFRIKELWKIILGELKEKEAKEIQIQKWICYRRIAAGLNKGQQLQISHALTPLLFSKKQQKIEIRSKSELYSYSENLRTLASFELIDMRSKVKIGSALVERIKMTHPRPLAAEYWALARIGARQLFHGSIANVVPKDICCQWIEQLLKIKHGNLKEALFAIGLLARKTDFREINLPESLIQNIFNCFNHSDESEMLSYYLLESNKISAAEKDEIFGEALPIGLTLEL